MKKGNANKIPTRICQVVNQALEVLGARYYLVFAIYCTFICTSPCNNIY